MSDQREPSYYEIALTSRQAFTAFVLLLICVVSSFFAGLWIGHGAGAADPFVGVKDQIARSEEAASQLEEVKFFGDKKEVAGEKEEVASASPQPTEPTKEPAATPTLLDQLAGEGGTSNSPARSGARPRQAAQRRPKDRPAGAAGAAGKPKEEPPEKEPAQADVQPAPPVESVQTAPPSVPSLPSGDQVIIQVFSSADQAQASRVLERLRADGYQAYVEPIQEKGKALFRVRVGPFASKAAADPVAAEVRRKHRLDTWITSAGG